MRLWSLHPRYFDRQALTACWREGLLAQAVILGRTRGYTAHPQLTRFLDQPHPADSIAAFLDGIAAEADRRGYRFSRAKIEGDAAVAPRILVAKGQLAYEWAHLGAKLCVRSPERAREQLGVTSPDPHPLFTPVEGPIASWERVAR